MWQRLIVSLVAVAIALVHVAPAVCDLMCVDVARAETAAAGHDCHAPSTSPDARAIQRSTHDCGGDAVPAILIVRSSQTTTPVALIAVATYASTASVDASTIRIESSAIALRGSARILNALRI
jgi:hypothetical protein